MKEEKVMSKLLEHNSTMSGFLCWRLAWENVCMECVVVFVALRSLNGNTSYRVPHPLFGQ